MKNKKLLILAFSLAAVVCNAQILKVSNGMAVSKLVSNGISYDRPLTSYCIMVGGEYLSTQYYEFSTEVGIYQKGGIQDIPVNSEDKVISSDIKNQIKYFHLNTTFRGKLPLQGITFFAGIGPKVDILLKSKTNTDRAYIQNTSFDMHKSHLNHILWGIQPEIGIMKEVNRIKLELGTSYIYDIGYLDNQNNKAKGNTFVITFAIGYRIK